MFIKNTFLFILKFGNFKENISVYFKINRNLSFKQFKK